VPTASLLGLRSFQPFTCVAASTGNYFLRAISTENQNRHDMPKTTLRFDFNNSPFAFLILEI